MAVSDAIAFPLLMAAAGRGLLAIGIAAATFVTRRSTPPVSWVTPNRLTWFDGRGARGICG